MSRFLLGTALIPLLAVFAGFETHAQSISFDSPDEVIELWQGANRSVGDLVLTSWVSGQEVIFNEGEARWADVQPASISFIQFEWNRFEEGSEELCPFSGRQTWVTSPTPLRGGDFETRGHIGMRVDSTYCLENEIQWNPSAFLSLEVKAASPENSYRITRPVGKALSKNQQDRRQKCRLSNEHAALICKSNVATVQGDLYVVYRPLESRLHVYGDDESSVAIRDQANRLGIELPSRYRLGKSLFE